MATITALPTVGLVDEARYERDATKPGGYGEAAGAGWWLACASVRWQGGGGGAVCMCGCACVGGCAGAFQTANKQLINRNPASGCFNVRKWGRKWVGEVQSRGVYLRTSGHAEAWRAAVELEWLLDRWCRKHGALAAAGALRPMCHRAYAAVCAQGLRGASW
jgi:hypothetical protein